MTAVRRLAAILAADVAGYSRLIGTDEEGTVVRLKSMRTELIDPAIGRHNARIDWRIGVNLGDIVIDDDDIHGDGVNIAARLEAMAEPGGICISRTVLSH